jgi:hypothetical protein|tara:strand:- start:36880 stop:39336 length:2457 start_codon:yes stop_codon:yes gene_type:complete
MYGNNKRQSKSFPDPLAPQDVKQGKKYGLKYAKAIEGQWGKMQDTESLYRKRNKVWERNRDYANGTQDTNIYKRILTSMDPNAADGSLVNLDYTPVPILPKFSRIVGNKILSRNPYPNLEAIDPISSSEKNKEKQRIRTQVQIKPELEALKAETGGLVLDKDPAELPDTLEEAEIFLETNLKTDAEISAQIGTNLTLSWNNFNDSIYRRCVNDLVALGMAVVKRSNDPNYGIKTEYVDPCMFVHSYTEDPGLNDLTYAGHIKKISIQELKRLAGDQFTEEDYAKMAQGAAGINGNDSSKLSHQYFDDYLKRNIFGYDEYMIDVLDFEFMSVDCMHFEDKENRYGNKLFFYEGFEYREKPGSVFDREPRKMHIATVYGGSYIIGTNFMYDYGMKANMPRNIHDISKCRLSYSAVATNIRRMIPKSMVDSCVGFADMLQITHLKIQQAIAKAKPDGLIIDIEGLENVQLGKGGELQPLELHDIYEQTGVFYYRSKDPEGGFQNPPIREIGNSIRNINELIGIYNHYLRLIRDATGVNEAMDASSPKGDALVGVREQAIAAGNNAIYDITNASMVLFKKVCEDIVKCLQIIPSGSVLMKAYQNAIGEENMKVLSTFSDLPMYNFGVSVQKEMEDSERQFLEQNIQVSLSQKELDLEDAIAIRQLKDINQAERLLIVRRQKRMKKMQEQAQQNSQMQAQQQAQASQAASQAKQQEMQMEAQIEAQKMQLKNQLEIQLEQVKHEYRKEIETIRAQATLGFRTEDQEFKEKLEVLKEDRKDDRIKKESSEQSKLISQRQGKRGEMAEPMQESPGSEDIDEILGL